MAENDNLRRLREFVSQYRHGAVIGSERDDACAIVGSMIDRLLAEDEPTDDRDDESWRRVFAGWLNRYHEGCRSNLQTLEDVVAALVRRALSSSPSRHVRGDQP